jgi:hypothetical protein
MKPRIAIRTHRAPALLARGRGPGPQRPPGGRRETEAETHRRGGRC